jgi:hypothetical protein
LTTKIHSSKKKHLIEIKLSGNVLGESFEWYACFNPSINFLKCTNEILTIGEDKVLITEEGRYTTDSLEYRTIDFEYKGSILSILHNKVFKRKEYIQHIKQSVSSIHSFDMLSPRDIKRKSRTSLNIGMSGENLSGFLSQLAPNVKKDVEYYLQRLYPWASSFEIKSFQSDWKELRIHERIGKYINPETGKETSYVFPRALTHVNDGTLRLLAILSSLICDSSLTLFDEVENGFNPHIIKEVVELFFIVGDKTQVIATTHSPEVLQYIPDEYIEDSIKFVYRKEDGSSGVADFFASQETQRKLQMLGPGEVYLDVDLDVLAKEFAANSSKHN